MGRRILITDDHPRATERFEWLLGRLDYNIRVAPDELQAIATAEDFRPDVILIDISMPKMNGFETAKHIRNQLRSRGMVLIAISGNWDEEHEQLRREAVFDAHLIKPAPVEEIVDLLKRFPRMDC